MSDHVISQEIKVKPIGCHFLPARLAQLSITKSEIHSAAKCKAFEHGAQEFLILEHLGFGRESDNVYAYNPKSGEQKSKI